MRRHIELLELLLQILLILNERVFGSLQMWGNSGSHWKREGGVSGVILRPIVVIGLAKMALLDLCHLSFLVELEL